MTAVCATHPQICKELKDLVYKCNAHVMVTPDKEIGIPKEIQWDRFQRGISISILHCQRNPKKIYRWDGMLELICRLRYGRLELLPDLTITFDSESRGEAMWTKYVRSGDTRRCQQYESDDEIEWKEDEDVSDNDDIDIDVWLQTQDGHPGNPVVAEILDHFLDLPPCKLVAVEVVGGLESRREGLPRYDPKRRIFDDCYMEDLSNALCLWLEGERDGIQLPHKCDFDENRLETLAYSWYEGRLYCDTNSVFD